MSAHFTLQQAADQVEQTIRRAGPPAGRTALNDYLSRPRSAAVLDFNAKLCTELRERDDRRRNRRETSLNLWVKAA